MGMSVLVAVLAVAGSLAVVIIQSVKETRILQKEHEILKKDHSTLREDHGIQREDHKQLSAEHREIAKAAISKLDALDMKQENFKDYVTAYIAKEEGAKTAVAALAPQVKLTEEIDFMYKIIAGQAGEVAQLKLELQKTKALLQVEKDINSQLRQELSAERGAHQKDINHMRALNRSHEDDDLEK